MTWLYALLLGAGAAAAMLYAEGGPALSPDGMRYLALGRDERVPSPFNRRWLLPMLLKERLGLWEAVSWASVVLLPVLVALYVPERPVTAAALMAFLPIQRINMRLPVLVDAPALALALAAALLVRAGHPGPAVAVALLAGACKETAPIFAALFAWSWWPLLGLLALVGTRTEGGHADPYTGKSPLKVARLLLAERRHDFLAWPETLLPWGAVLPLWLLAGPTLQSLATLGVATAQLLIATDKARLFQWAAPAVIAVAVHGASGPWLLAACALHAFNPYRGI